MRKNLSRKLNKLQISYLELHSIGDTMIRMINNIDTVRTGFVESFNTIVVAVCMIAGLLIMMAYTEWGLAVIAVILTLVSFTVMFTVTRRSQKYFVAQQRDLGVINGIVEETYYDHDIIHTQNGMSSSV